MEDMFESRIKVLSRQMCTVLGIHLNSTTREIQSVHKTDGTNQTEIVVN